MSRKVPDSTIINLLKDEEWLENKLINQNYSCSRLAKELGTTRTTVEKYRVFHDIQIVLSQKELTSINYQNKTEEEKKSILNKRKQTNKELYGEENTFISHKDKVTETMLEKYGVERALQSSDILKKQKQTMLDKYGVEHPIHNQALKEQQIQTNIDRYGVKNPGGLSESIQKAQQTSIDRYGMPHAMMNYDILSYARERFYEKYNTPELLETITTKRRETCVEKYGIEFANQSHLIQSIPLLLNKEWLIDQHHTQKKTLTQIGNELGCNITTVHRYCINNGVDIKYYYESAQQREVSDWVTSLGINVETNVRNIITGELDIYLPDYKLAIEYCGVFWHSDAHERMTPTYHLNKLKQCQKQEIRLLTIYEDEWVYNKDIIKRKIINILGKDTRSVYARRCQIIDITDKKIKKTFFDENHIQGSGPGSITYGLLCDNVIVAAMTFIRKPNGVFDLNRYASSIRVVGGFQKLLKHFQTNHNWNEILSFADLRWSEGNMYDKSGFTLDKILPPDYRYVKGDKTFHKFGFRRKTLEKILPNFDPLLTEVQNMKNAGYNRIYNCGLMRYVLKS